MSDINPLEGIDESELQNYSTGNLLSSEFLLNLYDIEDLAERARIRALIILQAKNLGVEKEVKDVLKAYDAADAKLGEDFSNSQHNETDFSFEPGLNLKCGRWLADDHGVRQQKADGSVVYASKIPIVPVALLQNISTDTEKIKLSFFKKFKRTIICDRKIVSTSSKITDLSSKGLEVTSENSKLLVKYISDCVVNNINEIPYYKAFSQLGWSSCGFVPYSSEAVFDGEEENRHLFSAITTSGDYDEWIRYTGELRKNTLVRLTMAASFASVLIEKVGALPFVFHLWGGTGTGKTVALKVAMSIWGNPAMGKMVRTMNMTQNSMLTTAAFLNSFPFAGDELQTIKSRFDNYDKLIMRITEGADRGRMSYDRNNEIKSWRCNFLFTGEEPCTQQSSGGGVKNRVIEVEVADSLFDNGNQTSTFVEANHGEAGHRFIDHITGIKDLAVQFRNIYDRVLRSRNTTEKQASSMALLLLADKLACECIYTDDVALTVDAALPYITSATEVDTAERAYTFIVNCIAANVNRFYITNPEEIYSGEIWGKFADDNKTTVFFNKTKLEECLVAKGFSFDAVKKNWHARGYIDKNTQNRYLFQTTVNSVHGDFVQIKLPQCKKEESIDEFPEL